MRPRKSLLGFEFVKLGHAYLCEEPLKPKGKKAGEPLMYQGKQLDWRVALKLEDERFLRVGESAYLVTLNDELVYVGEYSKTFESRWLRDGRYIWHGDKVDNLIKKALLNNDLVEIWITASPFADIGQGEQINISKAIEHKILRLCPPPWNTRNAGTGSAPTELRVSDLLSEAEREALPRLSPLKRKPYVKQHIRDRLEAAFANSPHADTAREILDKLMDILPSQKAWQAVCEYPEDFSTEEAWRVLSNWLRQATERMQQAGSQLRDLPIDAFFTPPEPSPEAHGAGGGLSWSELQRYKRVRVLP